ncbi:MAG: hypothetical protein QOG72_3093 [Sphingomonadales bacterium]|jgi:hypothetical protein|nr:hypothetical protein [Sphingomonadales bacterium]
MLLASLLLLAAQPAERCAISVVARADSSFAQAGYDASPERLAHLAAQTRDRFRAAALRLCRAGVLRSSDLARFGEMVVQNGEGATEPVLYREPGMKPRSFIFQYAFQDGGPPEAAAFEQALLCWKRPRSADCDLGD